MRQPESTIGRRADTYGNPYGPQDGRGGCENVRVSRAWEVYRASHQHVYVHDVYVDYDPAGER